MTKANRIHQHGSPEQFVWEDVEVGDPGPGQVRLRHRAVGVNFIDVYQRTGLYPAALPAILGQEGAGEVVAVGPGVQDLRAGDRVAYASLPGAYAQERLAPADRMVKLPDAIGDDVAAAMMLKGMTAEYLLRRTRAVQQGDTLLWHAAAGGVGLIATAWARALGATVIGTVGSRQKADEALAHGCHHVIVTAEEDFVARVRELTGGTGVDAVYDSVGQATFMRSLECLRPRGWMVSFGQASGRVPPLDVLALSQRGSLFLTRPTLGTYIAAREELEASARALFEVVESGAVRVEVRQRFALQDVAAAHRALESRQTVGSTILVC